MASAWVLSRSVMLNSFKTSLNVAYQTLLSMEFSRQEYWTGFPFPSPGNLPKQRIKPTSLISPESAASAADSLSLCHLGADILSDFKGNQILRGF